MGKFRYAIFSLILCVLCAPILVACGEGVPLNGISSEKAWYSVLQGESVKLEVNFTPAEATNKTVVYSVLSGEEYVTVDNEGNVHALVVDDKTAHEAQILVTPDYDSRLRTVFRVKILAEKISLASPEGLKYDNAKKAIVWDEVLFHDDSDGDVKIADYNPCYSLAIAAGNTEDLNAAQEFDVGRELSYSFGEDAFDAAGTYTVWVKSVSDDEETFADSSYSQRYVFTILDKPSTIEIKNYEILTPIVNLPNFDVSLSNYELSVFDKTQDRNISSAELGLFEKSTKQVDGVLCVCWQIPHANIGEDFGVGEFVLSIKLKGDGESFFDAVENGTKTFYQLDLPTGVALMENVVIWNAVDNALSYEVVVNDGEPIEVNTNRCELDGSVLSLDANIKVRAKGNGQERLAGKYALVDSVKLAKVGNLEATLNGSSTVLSWDEVSFAGEYQILLNGETKTITNQTTFSFTDNDMEFVEGENSVSVVAKPRADLDETNKHYIESDAEYLIFTKLANPTVKTRNGEIAWDAVEGATAYEIMLMYSGHENPLPEALPSTQTTYSLKNTNEKNYPAGEYKVCVRAIGARTIGDDVYVRSGKEILAAEVGQTQSFIKQIAPTNLQIDGDGYLTWTKGNSSFVSDESDYVIRVHNKASSTTDDDVEIRITTNKTGESLISYLGSAGFGEYVFSVKVENRKTNLRYINSEESEKVGFFRLSAPTGLKLENGELDWDLYDTTISEINEKIKNKFRFVLQVAGMLPIYVNQTEIINGVEEYLTSYVLKSSECSEGRNSVAIKAEVLNGTSGNNFIEINGSNVYLLSSDFGPYVQFTKLFAPQTPEISGDFLIGNLVDGATSYQLALTNSTGGTSYAPITIEQNGYWQIALANVMGMDPKDGRFTISVKAIGGDDSVDSNYSRIPLELFRMASPTIGIDNTIYQIAWNDVSATIDAETTYAQRYQISYKKDALDVTDWVEALVDGTVWDTSTLECGKYVVRVKALSAKPEIMSSAYSSEFAFRKLEDVDYTTLQVKNEYPYNTITWQKVQPGGSDEIKVDYLVSIYQKLSTGGKKLVETNVVETVGSGNPEFVFNNNLKLEKYEISVQSISDGYVKSSVSANNFVINRLARPTNLQVYYDVDDYKLFWQDEGNREFYEAHKVNPDNDNIGGCYCVYSNGISIEDYLKTDDWEFALATKLSAGSHGITIQAINKYELSQTNNSLTISSSESKEYVAVKLAMPTLSVSEGLLKWVDENNTKFGYQLIFDPDIGSDVYVDVDRDSTSYDMSSNSLTQGAYKVGIKVVGNGENYIDSDVYEEFENSVIKLLSPTYFVQNGMIKWNAIEHASSYSAVVYSASNESDKYNQDGIVDYEVVGGVAKYLMPLEPLEGKTGAIKFTLQSIGTMFISSSTDIAYINSNKTSVNTVYKWAVPTGIKIQDGEIAWNRISKAETSQLGRQIFSHYSVLYGENEAKVQYDEEFILSSLVTERETMDIKVCCVGTPDSNIDGAWINSDYTSAFTVTIAGTPTMYVEDGVLKWRETGQDSYYYDDYEILVNGIDAASINVTETLLTLNTFGNFAKYTDSNIVQLENIAAMNSVSSIKVRHKGVGVSVVSRYDNFVNSGYSNEITNIKKLVNAREARINNEGKFAWTQSDGAEDLIISVGDNEFEKIAGEGGNYSLVNGVFGTIDFSQQAFSGSNFDVTISYRMTRPNDATYKYLNSDASSINAYRFARANMIGISDDGLYLEWNYENQTSTASNDKFIITYKFKDRTDTNDFSQIVANVISFERNEIMIESNDDGTLNAKVPLWGVGTYQVSIQISSTSANVIPSESRVAEEFKMDKFAGGKGTITHPYIIRTINIADDEYSFFRENISATEQFYNIKKLPTLYFSLDEDVTLYEGSELIIKSQIFDNSIETNFIFGSSSDGESIAFRGGINGNGHTVHNYQVYNMASFASLFYAVVGDVVEGASANNFYNRSGIINNLKLEIDEFSYGNAYSDIGFFTTYGYGAWFVNCELLMSDDLETAGGLDVSVSISMREVLYGGIAARLYSANLLKEPEDGENINKNAKIINCKTDVNIQLVRTTDLKGSNTRAGGIVGAIYGASVINSANEGNLGASQIGGIVYEANDSSSQFGSVEWVNVISGCANKGKLSSFATKVDGDETGTSSQSGGILAFARTKTFVVNCLQAGELEVINGNYYINPNNTSRVYAIIGGIIGSKGGDLILMNCINITSRVTYNSSYVSSTSAFYGIAPVSPTAVSGVYYCSENSNYQKGIKDSEISFGISEADMKAGTGMSFVSFGDVNIANETIQNMPTMVDYPNAMESLGKLSTSLLYDSQFGKITLLYFDGTNYPTLKTYTII